ncbi:N-acetyltransferase [candidate division KSB1 bacterium]|nr:N-acetyltransferase [candidate division KSB1 bacterium]
MILRKARVEDATKMVNLINHYAKQGIMLPKSLSRLYENIRDFSIIESDGNLIGCGALHIYWENLAELRSLVIEQNDQHKGYGKKLVTYLLKEAQEFNINVVFALSFKPEFFKKIGFHEVEKESLPHKIWKDCLDCPHFPNCNETALKIELNKQAK